MRSERIAFVLRAHQAEGTMATLCRELGISRETGYKWLRRSRQVESLGDLVEQSRRPSRKLYRPYPPEWEYPSGSEVHRLRDNGCLYLNGHYYLVCHPLSVERV